MNRLLRVEVRRMYRRRLNIAMFGLAVLGIVVAGTVVFFKSSRDVEGATARARARAEVEYRDCLRGLESEDIPSPPPGFEPPPDFKPCGVLDPTGYSVDPLFHMRDFLAIAKGMAAPMIVLALLLGASFVGAEWHNRTITSTLTWEPRRVRLLLAKAIACAAVTFVALVALQALLGAALTPAAAWRGDFAGTGGTWFRSVAGAVLRSGATAAIASVIGLSIASFGRSTVAALGVAFGYFAVLEGIVRGVKPQWSRWLMGDNAAIFVSGDRLGFPNSRSVLAAGILLGIYACGAFAIAASSFRARDVG